MVPRQLLQRIPRDTGQVLVLSGVRRSGKSVLQAQVMHRGREAIYCNFEDTRLFGFNGEDFGRFLQVIETLGRPQGGVFLDEVQEVQEWERLVRTLVDRGHRVCVTGSNASLLQREVGAKLTGRHLSYEVTPFSYREYLQFKGFERGAKSLLSYLDEGGFPIYLREGNPQVLQELFRDVVQRDIVARHRIRDVRPLMNLALFLMCNTGQPHSFHKLAKSLHISTVAQTSRFMSLLQDAYIFFAVPKFSASFRQRAIAPHRYYAVDTGLRKANSPQQTHDLGHRLENAVYMSLRRRGESVHYASEAHQWECDFVTADQAIQVCAELTPENVDRELAGLEGACAMPGKRRPLLLTLDRKDKLPGDTQVIPAWEWLD